MSATSVGGGQSGVTDRTPQVLGSACCYAVSEEPFPSSRTSFPTRTDTRSSGTRCHHAGARCARPACDARALCLIHFRLAAREREDLGGKAADGHADPEADGAYGGLG